MTKPWVSEIHLDNDKVRSILKEQVPGLTCHCIEKLDEGWDTDIFQINESLIFRFARREFVIPYIQTEIRALPLLHDILSTPIPKIRHQGVFNNFYPYFSYPKLPGTIAADLALTESEKESLLYPITHFMNELHRIELSPETMALIPEDNLGRLDIGKRTAQIRDKIYVTEKLGVAFDGEIPADLFPRLSAREVQRLRCLVHGDLYSRNILIEDRTFLSGIIDWTDVHVGHPAKDLAFAVSFFSQDLLRRFMEEYVHFSTDLFYLSIFSALSHTCHLAEYAIDTGNELLIAECRTILYNIQENYKAYRA